MRVYNKLSFYYFNMFRQEAINAKKWKSTVILISTIPGWIVFTISLFLIISFILFVTFGSYTRRETIIGEIITQKHPVIITTNRSGYISESYIKPNQIIKKGDILFKITLDRISKSGDMNLNAIQSIREQIKSVDLGIHLLQLNEREILKGLDQQIENHKKIYKERKDYLYELDKQVKKYADLIVVYEKLFKQGNSTHDEVNNQRSRYFSQKSLYDSVKTELFQQDLSILNLENEIETQKTNFRNQIIRYEMQKSDLEIRLLEYESVSELIVSAPIDGTIDSISGTIGQVVKEGDPLAQVLPVESGIYQLVMWVPNSAISFVKLNDEVNIRYEAFPFEKFGQFKGKIKVISTLPASLQELSLYKNMPLELNQNIPLYKILIEIPDQKIVYNNKTLQFMNGMKAEATLFLENRKLYECMLFPVYNLTKNME